MQLLNILLVTFLKKIMHTMCIKIVH